MRQTLFKLLAILLPVVIILVMFEVLLRAAPSLIGMPILERFHPDLRASIAVRLGLPTMADQVIIPSSERFDKGPDLYLIKPNGTELREPDPADAAFGAINSISMDKRGFCNVAAVADRETVDIVTVGGSIPNCAYVTAEEEFSAPLGTLADTQSYNLAVRGVGPYEFVEVLKRYVDVLKPRLVIFAISEGNDLRDSQRYLDHLAGKTRNRTRTGGPFAFSYALAFIKGGLELAGKQVASLFDPDFRYSVQTPQGRVDLNIANLDLDELNLAKAIQDGSLSPELYRPPLEEFVRLAKTHNFVPLVVLVPAAYTVYAKSVAFSDQSLPEVMRNYSDAQRQWLAQNANSIGYEFLDIIPGLQRAAETRPLLYFPASIHPTREGHLALAEAVAPKAKMILAPSGAGIVTQGQ